MRDPTQQPIKPRGHQSLIQKCGRVSSCATNPATHAAARNLCKFCTWGSGVFFPCAECERFPCVRSPWPARSGVAVVFDAYTEYCTHRRRQSTLRVSILEGWLAGFHAVRLPRGRTFMAHGAFQGVEAAPEERLYPITVGKHNLRQNQCYYLCGGAQSSIQAQNFPQMEQ